MTNLAKILLITPLLFLVLVGFGVYKVSTLGSTQRGLTNPDITQANINENICNPSWSTKSIRPPTSYTSPIKRKLCLEQKCGAINTYELDHIVALTVGGHPSDLKNLELQPYDPKPNAREKDFVELRLNKAVCNGTLTLKEAQDILRTPKKWINYYNTKVKNNFGTITNEGWGRFIGEDGEVE